VKQNTVNVKLGREHCCGCQRTHSVCSFCAKI